MTMRGAPRRAGGSIAVALRNFAWDRAAIATMRHPSLPWLDGVAPEIELPATSLVAATETLGTRDRLSLTGQFAAHRAFLQSAGIPDGDFDAREWSVVRKRGSDCRLVRTSAREMPAGDDVPLLAAIQQFADCVKAPPLDVLKRSWARAETVFAEVHRKLRGDAAADLRWLHQSAAGEILAPGADVLREVWRGETRCCPIADTRAFAALAALDDSVSCVVLGGDFAIHRYAALQPLLAGIAGSADAHASVAERLIERLAARRHVVIVGPSIDDASHRVLDIAMAANVAMFVLQSNAPDRLPDGRFVLLSTRVGADSALPNRLAAEPDPRAWLETFVTGAEYDHFLASGELPVGLSAFDRLEEPRRSFVAALSLLGTRVPRTLAESYLRQFLFEAPLEQLAIEGLMTVDDETVTFVSDAAREHCTRHIPPASKPALCRAAASVADQVRAGILLIEAGEVSTGVALLEQADWTSAQQTVRTLEGVPASALSPRLAEALAWALVAEGRYDDARDIAPLLPESRREVVLAACERHTGQYASALSRLRRAEVSSFETRILEAELSRLTGALDEAAALLSEVEPRNDEERIRASFEKSVLALERGDAPDTLWAQQDHYYVSRFRTYEALLRGVFEEAEEHAARSLLLARCVSERIDSALDRVYASFSSGRWNETRAMAVESLALIDEAQGDRGAAGILLTLAYLAADDGQWAAARQHIQRLRLYYDGAHDEAHLAEIDVLSAHLEFSRGNFAEARDIAVGLVGRRAITGQIREAAALILDEIEWIEGSDAPLLSRGNSRNRELENRHELMLARRGVGSLKVADAFMSNLAAWERSPGAAMPVPRTGSEKLKLMRSALGCRRSEVAQQLAAETGATISSAPASISLSDVELLRRAANAEFPLRNDALGPVRWCFAARNRLGHWSVDGPAAVDSEKLDDALVEPARDWIRCSDRELLFIEGSSSWPEASRSAIAAVFRTRAENYRLRRLLEQEEAVRPAAEESVEGIIGESPAMRAVFALIDRVARRDVPVCVLGESGTGKELVGRAIHRGSPRKQKPFTAVNCAALPETLVESELFGHVRGAFTGADRDRAGLIETTDGGTLFLDEIGEMPLAAQAKLLRFLQDGEFRRVGDTTNRTADVRIVSATNRKLELAVEEGRFREDLYYRIRGIDIVLPRLRDRGRDVILLAEHFLGQERARHRAGPQALSSEAEALLAAYSWPGNVRELQNTIRAAHAIAGDAREIDLEHLPERVRSAAPVKVLAGSYQDAVAHFRRDLIEKSLAAAAGNQNRAAALLNISRQALAYQIRELGILVGKNPQRQRV